MRTLAGKNKKHSDDIKEKALFLYATNGNITRTAEEIGVSKSTVHRWINEPENCEEVERVRTEKRMEFADRASEIIESSLQLLERRIDTALEHENELDALIGEIFATPNEEISQDQKNRLVRKINALQVQRLGEITTVIGTMYDKRALARGESTQNIGGTLTIENYIDKVKGNEY